MSTSSDPDKDIIEIGPLTVTPRDKYATLQIAGKEIPLFLREAELLAFLAKRADTWVSKITLYREFWSNPRPHHRAIDVSVCKLRATITQELREELPDNQHHLVSNGNGSYMLSSEPRPMIGKAPFTRGKQHNLIEECERIRYT
jgi:DNA-binding response OmpR family regulator